MFIESALCIALSSFSMDKNELISRIDHIGNKRFEVVDIDPSMERLFRLLLEEVGGGFISD